eukprot:scaffold3941_cov412-Prasinococcus_capsulatus_cf.AAC.20
MLALKTYLPSLGHCLSDATEQRFASSTLIAKETFRLWARQEQNDCCIVCCCALRNATWETSLSRMWLSSTAKSASKLTARGEPCPVELPISSACHSSRTSVSVPPTRRLRNVEWSCSASVARPSEQGVVPMLPRSCVYCELPAASRESKKCHKSASGNTITCAPCWTAACA